MSRFVVDASVAVKWYFSEVDSPAALRLLSGDHALVAPDLLFVEFGNTLWKRTQRGQITTADSLEILRDLFLVPFDIQPSRKYLAHAIELAAGLGRTVYDSLYLSIAILSGCAVITADRRLLNTVRNSPFKSSILCLEELV